MDKSDKIGLFGGTFDPIHNGHIEMALYAKLHFQLSKIFFITAKEPPFKSKTVFFPANIRHHLTEKAISEYPDFLPSPVELNREGISYAYQTVEYYRSQNPNAELFWIMGLDAYNNLDQWKNSDYIKSQVKFIVFARGPKSLPLDEVFFVENFSNSISSTAIRQIIGDLSLDEITKKSLLKDLIPQSIISILLDQAPKQAIKH
jgi:nicotinate (nicotinamide) nucleotide adenylyltransferase